MFQILSIMIFLILVFMITVHFAFAIASHAARREQCRMQLIRSIGFWSEKIRFLHKFKQFLYLSAMVSFTALLLSGFFPVVLGKGSLSGYPLLLHTTAAAVFVAAFVLLALSWAPHFTFCADDFPIFMRKTVGHSVAFLDDRWRGVFLQKLCFWLMLILVVPLILSIVISMYPFFDATAQNSLISLHRLSALFLSVAAITQTYLLLISKTNKMESDNALEKRG